MKVRQFDVSESDARSARLFFDAVRGFYDLSELHVLDAFARNGQLTVSSYQPYVNQITAWELGAEHEDALVDKVGAHNVRIGCSYATAEEEGPKYDMVVIDTPQGLHHDSTGKVHAEHFDFLEITLERLLTDRGLVVLYVNRSPYNRDEVGSHGYDEYAEYDFEQWMRARQAYYGAVKIDPSLALQAYKLAGIRHGFELVNETIVPCYSDVEGLEPYSFRVCLEYARKA